jgi:hypothetical protein
MRVISFCATCLIGFAIALWVPGRSQAEDSPWYVRGIESVTVPPAAPGQRNPIDAFLTEAQSSLGIRSAPEADRRTLMRRLVFDLTGMPPTPMEMESFLADTRPDAYERLVDRLLASPSYGEKWGRFWLDQVRYAETHGYERDDPKPGAWRYRDYVISRLNEDVPYDRFVREQLAGDELPDANVQTLIATAIYRLGLIDDEPADPVTDRFDQLDDMMKVVGTTFLGLSIHCARCHDHKFDPIPQADYYKLLAFFTPGEQYRRDDVASISIDLASPSELDRIRDLNASIDRQLHHLRAQKDRRIKERSESDMELQALQRRIEQLEKNRPANPPMVLGFTDSGVNAEPVRILPRGNAHAPGEEVSPGFLSILDATPPKIIPPADGRTTGRRLALAEWIARRENPLTARVIVNRLWQQHFGRGIVGTPSDFGAMGESPSNQPLLDWLALELIRNDWRWKPLHRLIVTSAAYRRSGRYDAQADQKDPGNTSVWRFTPRRLEAEAIRDAALMVSGTLDLKMGGPSIRPAIDPAVLAGQSRPGAGWEPSIPTEAARRSIYVYVKRTLPVPELEVMDAPDTAEPCPQRVTTTTAPQSLVMFNGPFWHDQADRFASRLDRECRTDALSRIRLAFQLAYSRAPSAIEEAEAIEFLRNHARTITERDPASPSAVSPEHEAWKAFCLILLNSNEFLYVD